MCDLILNVLNTNWLVVNVRLVLHVHLVVNVRSAKLLVLTVLSVWMVKQFTVMLPKVWYRLKILSKTGYPPWAGRR